MTFSQLHERLRSEIARRIDRGQLTGTLLAQQTGLRPSHLSNFIHRKRSLSLSALDRVLAAQSLSIDDILPETARPALQTSASLVSIVPLVSESAALHSPIPHQRAILELIHLPAGSLENLRPRRTLARRNWQRFLAVRLAAAQAAPMHPVLRPGAIVVIDRHYNSLAPNHPSRPNIYAVNFLNTLAFRYVSYEANRVILRPHTLDSPIDLLRLGVEESPSTCIVGRVCLTIAEL
ncbi:MAG: helix-turn-helix domain-containing protein [Acidobacteriaceae bacterium]